MSHDHPFSCYPGHFGSWRPGISALPAAMPVEEWGMYSYGPHICLISRVVRVTDQMIYRMMGKKAKT